MPKSVLIDAGPIVAFLYDDELDHNRAVDSGLETETGLKKVDRCFSPPQVGRLWLDQTALGV